MRNAGKILGIAALIGLVALGFRSEAVGAPVLEWTSSPSGAAEGISGRGQTGTRLPRILSPADSASYETIFKLQDKGRWKDADRVVKNLRDDALMADVLAQRYLSAGKYRASFDELKAWMDSYADHPDAPGVYALAVQRAGKNAEAVARPDGGSVFGGTSGDGTRLGKGADDVRGLTSEQRRRAGALKSRFRTALHSGDTKGARGILESEETQTLLGRAGVDRLRSLLSFSYFIDGMDDLAQDALRSAGRAPLASWSAGLAAWRQGRMDTARTHFESLALNPDASSWLQAAGGFWAARANLKDRRPQHMNRWLALAASHPRTFYGLLARRSLGLHTDFDWNSSELSAADTDLLLESPTGRRVLALIQAGQKDRAERQLRQIYPAASDDEQRAVVALAQKANMASLTMSLGSAGDRDGTDDVNDSAHFPVPSWSPEGGWRIDRALVLALVRQESRFIPDAKSPAGARGLMQLMPATAAYVARVSGQKHGGKASLDHPETNLMLGQKYVERLLQDPAINGNLLMMAAAYNAGPGNLAKWRANANDHGDPLLFMETIPMSETRTYVERVLTNYWMYRMRLNQPTPSLDALASGEWPLYVQLDDHSRMVAENVPH